MKVLLIHQYFCLPNQNGNQRSYDLALELVNRGHDVEVITSKAHFL